MHRRSFIVTASAVGVSALARADAKKKEPEVSPVEDLMQEHGVIERLLLIYEEGIRQLGSAANAPFPAILKASDLIKRFVEDYHEKNEEQCLFPRFEKSSQHKELVAVLRRQHDAGRQLTSQIHSWSKSETASSDVNRKRLTEAMRSFIRMYRPHAAREDTVLFPAFRELVPEKEYDALGEQFETQEHKLFGEHGFEHIVGEVAAIEASLGIASLADFTPKP